MSKFNKKIALILSVVISFTSFNFVGLGAVNAAEGDMDLEEVLEDGKIEAMPSEDILEDPEEEERPIEDEQAEVEEEVKEPEGSAEKVEEINQEETVENVDEDLEEDMEEVDKDLEEEPSVYSSSQIDELDRKLDGIIDELYDIEISVPQELRDRIAEIASEINSIDDWASKEGIFNKHSSIEEDINIKDQLGYLKGQIDAHSQNPNPDLKDRIQGEINTLRDRIKNQKLSKNAENNDYQLDLLEGILGGKSDSETEDEIREILDRIRGDLEATNGEIAGDSTRKDVNLVKDLIDELAPNNDKKAEFKDELNELTKDMSIKDQLYDLEKDIEEYLNQPNSDIKDRIESKIIIIRGQINGEKLSPHSDHNREKLERLIEKFNQKNGEAEKEKEKNIEDLLEKIKKDLAGLNGGPAGESIRSDYDRVEGLISELADSNIKKAGFIAARKNLKEDIDIKDDLQELLEEVDKFLQADDNPSKKEIDIKIEEMRGRIKSQILSPHKDHNNSRLKDIVRKIEDKEVESEKEKEKNIEDLLEKIKKDLADLNGGPAGESIRADYEKVVGLISKLPETNKNKSSYLNKSANLKEDIDIKDDIFKLAGKVGVYEKESGQSSSLRDEIIGEYFRLKGVIAREVLSPHKEHNDKKLMELKDRIDKKDKETEGQIEDDIENRLNRLEKDLADLKGEPAPADIEAFAGGIKEDILKLNDSNAKKEKFLYRMGELEDDIQIKKDILQVNNLVDQYENYEGDKDVFTGEINSEGNNVRMRIVKEKLEPHKIDNMEKLDRIRSRFEDMKDKEEELAKNDITNLLEKIKNDLEDLNGEKPGQGILDDLGRVKSMISKLPKDNKDLAIYNERVKDLEEDILIKDDLDSLSKKVLDYRNNKSEEVKNEIEKNIEDLSKRIENQVLMPHDIHNKNKLIKLREDFERDKEEVLEEDILKLLEEIRQELEALNGGDVNQEIRDKYDKAFELISKLNESSKNKEKYLKEASYLEEDIRIKDWLKDLSAKMDQYVNSEDDKLKEELIDTMQKLRGNILDQKLTPHKDHNMKRLVDIYNRFLEKESDKENKQEEEILGLIDKIRLELAERDGSPALESTRNDYLRLEKLIDSLASKNENKALYIEKAKELKEDMDIKDELNSLSKKIDGYLKNPNEELKAGLEKEIDILRGRIKVEILEPHKDQNLNKLRLLEESIREKEETVEAEKEANIVKLLEEVKEELELKNGDKSDDSTKLKLEDAKKLIDQLKKTNKNKANYILTYRELSKDIEIKDDLSILSRDMDEYIKGGEESDRSRLIDEMIRLRGVITGEKILPHKDHNMKKLTDIYNKLISKEEGDLSKKEDEIERLLIEIKTELEMQKGEPIKSETGKKMDKVYELIGLLPDTSKKKAGFNRDFNNLYEDAVIKNQVKYINDRILEFKERPSKELEKEIRDTSSRILDRIGKQVLVPHKDHNRAKLKELLDDFEKEIGKNDERELENKIGQLLDKIKKDLERRNGSPALDGTRSDLKEVNGLINSLSETNNKKKAFKEDYKELSRDMELKDQIEAINIQVDKLNKENLKEAKKKIEEDILILRSSIDKQKLSPHKIHNKNRLASIEEIFKKKVKELEEIEVEQNIDDRISYLLEDIQRRLAELKGEQAPLVLKNDMNELEKLIDDLDSKNPKKRAYMESARLLRMDIQIKDELKELEEEINRIKLFDEYSTRNYNSEKLIVFNSMDIASLKIALNQKVYNNIKDLDEIKEELREAEGSINQEKLYPHGKHNRDKLLKLNSSLISKKLGVISEVLASLNGEPADKEIKEEILKLKEEIELMDLDEDEIKYERERIELSDDVRIKDDLAKLERDIEKLNKNSSSKDKSRAKDEIYRLEKAIKGQKMEPHKTDNFNKLLGLEKLYRKKTSDSTNIKPEGGGSSGGKDKDRDKDRDHSKDRDKDLENIDKDLEEIEKDINDKEAGSDKDIGEIEKDIEAVEKDIDKLTNKKDRDDRNNKLDKLKDRLEKLKSMVAINNNYHKSYMTGYKDGSIRPQDTTTREEVAKVIYSILDDKKLEKFRTKSHNFKDLKSGTWSEEYVATLTRAGILTGYSDGSFKPKKEITRGELAVIVAKINGLYEKDKNRFNDISEHWARGHINAISEKSWIKGYEDGSFRPRNYITRAEFVTMVNSMLNRNRKSEGSLDDIKKFKDLEEGKWYYDEIIEAVTDHRP